MQWHPPNYHNVVTALPKQVSKLSEKCVNFFNATSKTSRFLRFLKAEEGWHGSGSVANASFDACAT